MQLAKTKTSLDAALLGDCEKETIAGSRADIKVLFETSAGYELAGLARLQSAYLLQRTTRRKGRSKKA